MDAASLIKQIERYRKELIRIMNRFDRSAKGIHINSEDEAVFRTYVIEVIDLLNDSFGKNKYSIQINQIFNEGVSNFLHSPSFSCVEEISSVLKAVETRLKNNPNILNKKEEQIPQSATPLLYPEKMTLKWLWDHVPWNYWIAFIVFLFSVFLLGIAFSETELYKSLTKTQPAAINNTISNPINNK